MNLVEMSLGMGVTGKRFQPCVLLSQLFGLSQMLTVSKSLE